MPPDGDLWQRLAHAQALGALHRARLPAWLATGAAALRGVLGGAGFPAPATAPLSALGPPASLALAAVVGFAWLSVWRGGWRGEVLAAADEDEGGRLLAVRGLGAWRLAGPIAWGLAPGAQVWVRGGLAASTVAYLTLRVLGHAVPLSALWSACGWVLVTAAGLGAAAVTGRLAGLRAVPQHFRQAAFPRGDVVRRYGLDGILLAAGLALAWAAPAGPPSLRPLLAWGAVLVMWGARRSWGNGSCPSS